MQLHWMEGCVHPSFLGNVLAEVYALPTTSLRTLSCARLPLPHYALMQHLRTYKRFAHSGMYAVCGRQPSWWRSAPNRKMFTWLSVHGSGSCGGLGWCHVQTFSIHPLQRKAASPTLCPDAAPAHVQTRCSHSHACCKPLTTVTIIEECNNKNGVKKQNKMPGLSLHGLFFSLSLLLSIQRGIHPDGSASLLTCPPVWSRLPVVLVWISL